MRTRSLFVMTSAAAALASCSFGPHLKSALPQVRSVPVLAGLSPAESLGRARAYLASKQYGLAIELFRSAGRDPSLEIDSLNGLAIAYDGIGRGDLAERYFEKALALRTDDGRTRRNLAAFYQTSGQGEKAAKLSRGDIMIRHSQTAAVIEQANVGAEKEVGHASAAAQPAVFALRDPSPLTSAFRPLLANMSFAQVGVARDDDLPNDAIIVCGQGVASPGKAPERDRMRMFRISVGEVFITSEPEDASCTIDSSGNQPASSAITNGEYLGLVAAYLDHMNRMQFFAERAMSKTSHS